jgi:tetratricopeptide (TPR) repeat protein
MMFRSSLNRIAFASAILLVLLGIACNASADGSEQQVCDVGADYALGIENYPEAIRLHAEVVRKRPDDALAHYHLGFAEGMMGNRTDEVREYQRAAALGLRNWDRSTLIRNWSRVFMLAVALGRTPKCSLTTFASA